MIDNDGKYISEIKILEQYNKSSYPRPYIYKCPDYTPKNIDNLSFNSEADIIKYIKNSNEFEIVFYTDILGDTHENYIPMTENARKISNKLGDFCKKDISMRDDILASQCQASQADIDKLRAMRCESERNIATHIDNGNKAESKRTEFNDSGYAIIDKPEKLSLFQKFIKFVYGM